VLAVALLTSCVPFGVRVVQRGVPTEPRVREREDVAIFTPETGKPERPHHRNGVFELRTVLVYRRDGSVLPSSNGFLHLEGLRSVAFDHGCEALVVARPELEYDEILCGRRNAQPLPCFLVHRATCVVFD
jgi:hypothetical protein